MTYFDPKQFNKDFENYIKEQKEEKLQREQYEMNDLTNQHQKHIYDLSIKEIFINTSIMWKNIITLQKKSLQTNDILYIIITILVFFLIFNIILSISSAQF